MDPFFPVARTFEKCMLRFGPKNCVAFRKIELNFGGQCPGIRNLIPWNSSTRQQNVFLHFFGRLFG